MVHSPFTNASIAYTCPARHLGAAASLLGEPEKARAYYEQGIEAAGKIRFRPEIALIRLQLAEVLLEHYPDERSEALEHLDFAIGEFRRHEDAAVPGTGAVPEDEPPKMSLQGIDVSAPQASIDAVVSAVEVERPNLRRHGRPRRDSHRYVHRHRGLHGHD